MKIFTEKSSKNLIWIGVLFIFIGLFSFQIGERIFDFSSEIKADKIGQLGDFFGGVIGSIWALAGVILFYVALKKQTEALEDQKKSTTAAINSLEIQTRELKLQRTELEETRKEFLLNRTTTLVYNQLERFEKALSELNIVYLDGLTHKGNDAILFLDKNSNTVYNSIDNDEEKYNADMKQSVINLLKIYTPNRLEIEKFAHNIYTSVEVLKRIVFKTNLDLQHLNDLKNLFFVNIGFINMGVIERISEIADLQHDYLKAIDYVENNLDISTIMHADIFLSSVKDFYQLHLTPENFEENKSTWIKKLGNIEK